MSGSSAKETLERTVTFLAKRDGIDKVLKLIRYTAKLVLAAQGVREGSAAYAKLKSLDSSLGTTRKALRVGKFLNNVKAALAVDLSAETAPVQLLAAAGEGAYFFIDQFVWLVKSGVLDARLEAKLSKASAWAELFGYCGSITINSLALRKLREQAAGLNAALRAAEARKLEGADDSCAAGSGADKTGDAAQIRAQLTAVRAHILLRSLLLLQDAADTLIALHEITSGRVPLTNATVLAVCGIVSGSISAWKNWPT